MYLTAEQVEIKTRDLKEMNIDGDLYDQKDVSVSIMKEVLSLVNAKTEK